MQRRVKELEGRKRDPSLIMFLALNMILLAFFILLVALSQPNKTKEAELAIEVKKAFRTFGGTFLGLGGFIDQSGVSDEQSPNESQYVADHQTGSKITRQQIHLLWDQTSSIAFYAMQEHRASLTPDQIREIEREQAINIDIQRIL